MAFSKMPMRQLRPLASALPSSMRLGREWLRVAETLEAIASTQTGHAPASRGFVSSPCLTKKAACDDTGRQVPQFRV
jgi:hypothetical protein